MSLETQSLRPRPVPFVSMGVPPGELVCGEAREKRDDRAAGILVLVSTVEYKLGTNTSQHKLVLVSVSNRTPKSLNMSLKNLIIIPIIIYETPK